MNNVINESKKVMELQPKLQAIFNEVDSYDNSEFDLGDVVGISKVTTKQDKLFDYVDAPYYLKKRVRDYDYDKDDFDLGR